MQVSLNQIKKLRRLTKAGVIDCRRALAEAKGDLGQAKKWLEEKSAAVAAKKAGRETVAGLIEVYLHNNGRVAAMVKLSSETDFVSRNQEFKKLAHELAMQTAAMNPASVEELLEQEYIRDSQKKIRDLIKEAIAQLKENIKVEAISRMEV